MSKTKRNDRTYDLDFDDKEYDRVKRKKHVTEDNKREKKYKINKNNYDQFEEETEDENMDIEEDL